MLTTLSTFMISIFSWIHGRGHDSFLPVCEANSHPGENIKHETNA